MNRLISNKILDCNCQLTFVPGGDPGPVAGLRRLLHQKDATALDSYNQFFGVNPSFRPERILEIGVAYGGSLAMWADCFDCQVVGVDRNGLSEPAMLEHLRHDDRIRVETITAPSPELMNLGVFGMIVDDGAHDFEEIVPTFELLWDRLRPGGLYVIEDWTYEGSHRSWWTTSQTKKFQKWVKQSGLKGFECPNFIALPKPME